MTSSNSGEAERIRQVYAGYDQNPATLTKWSLENQGNAAIHKERKRVLSRMLAANSMCPLAGQETLEIGCGSGLVMSELLELGADPSKCRGIDLLPNRIEEAKRRHPQVAFETADASRLSFAAREFDLVLGFTLFSSVLDDGLASAISKEMSRVLKPTGAILLYDLRYNNPLNVNVRRLSKARIRQLFPAFSCCCQSLTLLPPLARRLRFLTSMAYPMLALIPFLRTHHLALLRRYEAA